MADAPAASVIENGVSPATQEKIEEDSPGFKVFAGNLAYTVDDEGLKAFFAPVQHDILSAQVILRGTRSAGYGFVALSSAEAAQKAVDVLNKTDLDGRSVIVEVAKPADQKDKERSERRANRRPGRRGGKAVPGEVTEAEANGDTQKLEAVAPAESGAESKPKKKKKNTRKPKRKVPPEEADNAHTAEAAAPPAEGEDTSADAAGKKRNPRQRRTSRPARPAGEDPIGEPSKTMLFVANLTFNIDDAALSALFTDAGIKVSSARVVRRRWGQPRKSKGYGFVDVGSEEEQKKAIEALQGKELEGGRQIAVKVAVNSAQDDDEKVEGANSTGKTA